MCFPRGVVHMRVGELTADNGRCRGSSAARDLCDHGRNEITMEPTIRSTTMPQPKIPSKSAGYPPWGSAIVFTSVEIRLYPRISGVTPAKRIIQIQPTLKEETEFRCSRRGRQSPHAIGDHDIEVRPAARMPKLFTKVSSISSMYRPDAVGNQQGRDNRQRDNHDHSRGQA